MSSEPGFVEAPTSFTVGANNANAILNNRTERLKRNGLVNVIGLDQHDLRDFLHKFWIGDMEVSEINDFLDQNGLGRLTIRPTSALLENYNDFGAGIESLYLINPPEVQNFASDKAKQRKIFWEQPGVVIPYQPTDAFVGDQNGALRELEEEFEGYEDVPLFEQDRAGSKGEGYRSFKGGLDEVLEKYREEGVPSGRLLSFKLPIKFDQRVIAADDNPVTSFRRYPGERDICSLSDVEGENYVEKARNARERGYAEPVEISDLDPAVERILQDHVEATKENLGEENIWAGWDFFAIDPYEADYLPEDVRDHLFDSDYRTEEGDYLVFGEPNTSPGSGVDVVNEEYPEQDSAANLVMFADSLSRDLEFEPGIEKTGCIDESELYEVARTHVV